MKNAVTSVMFLSLVSIAGCISQGESASIEADGSTETSVLDAVTDAVARSDTPPPSELPGRLDGDTQGDDGSPPASDGGAGSECNYPLAVLQTGKDNTCPGGNVHRWPLGLAATSCHGWLAVAPSGETHENSANAIACTEDGGFTFTQFAGNLACQGNGTVKTYAPDVCEQDIPPVLYTKAINLACCMSLTHPDCEYGSPSVSVPGGQSYVDGQLCR